MLPGSLLLLHSVPAAVRLLYYLSLRYVHGVERGGVDGLRMGGGRLNRWTI